MNPIATAQYGLFAASQRFDASAQRVGRLDDPSANVDLATEVVDQIGARQAFKADLAVIRTATQMQDALLNLIA